MIKYFTTLQNERGDVLPSYRAQVTDSAGTVVTIYADKGGTRFTDASGNNVNYATADEKGRISFYFTPAVGMVLQTLDLAGNLQDGEADFADGLVLDALPGEIAQSAVTDLVTDLGNKAETATLASTAGASAIGYQRSGGNAKTFADFLELQPFYPEDYGAVGNAFYFNTADSTWYEDGAYSTAATDDSTALQACIDAANAAGGYVKLTSRYLVGAQLDLGKGSMVGTFASQWNGTTYGNALCASHSLTSTRGSENDFSNAVLRIDNSSTLIGGGKLADFAIIGNTQNTTDHDNRADRCALQGFFWINGYMQNLHISGFSRPAMSFVGLCQDMATKGMFIINCGQNDGTYYAAYEHKPNVSAYGSIAAGRAPNALHHRGWRVSGCPAYVDFDHGSSNLGEVSFVDCKIEHRSWQTGTYGTQDPLINVGEGVGSLFWGAGSTWTVPVSENSSGTAVWFADIKNYQTEMVGITVRGDPDVTKLLRFAKSGGVSKATRSGSRFIGQVRNVSTQAASLDFQHGEIDITVWQDLTTVTANSRAGIKLGRGAVLKRADFRAEEATTVNIAAGFLVEIPNCQYEVQRSATFTASITSTTLDVTAVSSGTIQIGQTVTNAAGDKLGRIASFGTGSGGTGTYTLGSAPGAVSSTTLYSGFAGVPEIQNLNVHDDGSALAQVGRFYGNNGGSFVETAYAHFGKVCGPTRPVVTSPPTGNRIDLRTYGDRHIKIDYSGAVVDMVLGAGIGDVITLEAGSNAFTLSDNGDITTSTGANKTINPGEVVALRMISGRDCVEIGGAPQAATSSATYVAPSGGTTVDTEARAALAQLAADHADLVAQLQAADLQA